MKSTTNYNQIERALQLPSVLMSVLSTTYRSLDAGYWTLSQEPRQFLSSDVVALTASSSPTKMQDLETLSPTY
jgi:hypothetical protein